MAEIIRRHGLLMTWVVLFAISLQLMSFSIANRSVSRVGARLVDGVLFPMEKGYHEISESAKYLWRHYIWLLEVETERNTFLERIKELESLNSRLMESEGENERLRKLLQFGEQTGHNGVVASVVGRDPSNWVKTITIDRGTDDGLRPGLAVVDGHAIVGQTTVVNARSTKVLLLNDATSAIDAILQTTRVSGIVEGGLEGGMLRLRYVEKLKEFPVQPGDRVIASGLDGVYPKGTLIGVIERVDPSVSSLFHSIEVRPSVDLSRLENVMVILPADTGGAPIEEKTPTEIVPPADAPPAPAGVPGPGSSARPNNEDVPAAVEQSTKKGRGQ